MSRRQPRACGAACAASPFPPVRRGGRARIALAVLLLVGSSCAQVVRVYEGPAKPNREVSRFQLKAGDLAQGHTAFDVRVDSIDGIKADSYWAKSERPLIPAGAEWHLLPGWHSILIAWRSSDRPGQHGGSWISYAVTRTGTLAASQDFEAGKSYKIVVTAGTGSSSPYEVQID